MVSKHYDTIDYLLLPVVVGHADKNTWNLDGKNALLSVPPLPVLSPFCVNGCAAVWRGCFFSARRYISNLLYDPPMVLI